VHLTNTNNKGLAVTNKPHDVLHHGKNAANK